jgi:hypothetical protein
VARSPQVPLPLEDMAAAEGHAGAQAQAALVALLQLLLPEGERRYLRDFGIMTLPLAHLNAVLAPLGYMLVGSKTRAADRFVLCTDARGQVEPYGLFELRRVAEGNV